MLSINDALAFSEGGPAGDVERAVVPVLAAFPPER